ncbi:hypothetical protein EDB83DRAFT_1445970 [Lactarius deliciosus]|nr:hypothetical protein EDB83DRAFT_1445970 [Lactarius deliciosus]
MWVFSHVCCKDRLLSLTRSFIVLLTFCQTDVSDVGLPSNDERGEQFVAKVSTYTRRASWSLSSASLIPVSFLSRSRDVGHANDARLIARTHTFGSHCFCLTSRKFGWTLISC